MMATTHSVFGPVREFVEGVDRGNAIRLGVTRSQRPTRGVRRASRVDQHSTDGGPAQPGGLTLYHSKRGWRA